MYSFSNISESRLITCNNHIIEVVRKTIKIYNFSVVCGYRGKKEQNEAYRNGYSDLMYPNSKHNKMPSNAVDLAPWNNKYKKIDWMNFEAFYFLGGLIIGISNSLGYNFRWGGSWDGKYNIDIKSNESKDLGHFEEVVDG